jgi:hypothetical protein
VDQADADRALADRRRHPLHRPVPDVTDREHPRQARLQQERRPFERPVLGEVPAGQQITPAVASDGLGQPVGERLGTDEDEQAGSRDPLGNAGGPVPRLQLLRPLVSCARSRARLETSRHR